MYYAEWNPEALLREQNQALNTIRIFAMAVWKTMHIHMSFKGYYFKVLLISLVFLIALAIVRAVSVPQVQKKIIYHPIEINDLDLLYEELERLQYNETKQLNWKIYFTPPAKPFEELIARAVTKLNLKGFVGVASNMEMERLMQKENFLAGVYFKGVGPNIKKLPIKLDYELRFPSILRTSPNPNSPLLWGTQKLYPLLTEQISHRSDIVHYTNSCGIPPAYIEEGFLPLQHAIAMSFLELKSGLDDLEKAGIPKIQLHKFPYRRYVYDRNFLFIKVLLTLSLLFAYVFPSYILIKAITDEVERGIMKLMRIELINWCAWLLIMFILQFITSLISCFILGSSWWNHAVFNYGSWFPIFCFLLCYVCADVTFILMISIVVIRKRKNTKYGVLLRILTLTPYPLILIFYYEIPIEYKLISCLSLDTGLAIGLNIIMEFESSGEGYNWKNFRKAHFAGDDLSVFHVCLILLLDSVVYLLILIYQHYKYPPEVATIIVDKETMARKWYYPVETLYEFMANTKGGVDGSIGKRIAMYLLTHLTVHEDDLNNEDSGMSISPGEHRDKKNQTGQPKTMKDKGTNTPGRFKPPFIPTRKSSIISIVGPELKYTKSAQKRKRPVLPDLPTDDTTSNASDSFEGIPGGRPDPLHTWESIDNASYLTEYPDSTHSDSLLKFSFNDLTERENVAIVNEELFDKTHGIQVIEVCKIIGDTAYLNDITMIIHPKEITVILSQEESSKMLTHIISGDIAMTSGQVLINDVDVTYYKGKDTLCCILPTHSLIFRQLTASENLYFYMHLRGMRNYRQIVREIHKYLKLLRMELIEAEELAEYLSYGQARCLSLCCTLSGGNHAVIVDDPCIGLHKEHKYQMWDILRSEGRKRVIIVNTHYCDEAEILGDRIAVLHNGKLQCYDRKKSLRRKYCNNYQLYCELTEGTEVNRHEFLTLLYKHFPLGATGKYIQKTGRIDVTFPQDREMKLVELLADLEVEGPKMGIQFVWVKRKTLYDVFIHEVLDYKVIRDSMIADDLIYRCLNNELNETNECKKICLEFCAIIKAIIIQRKRYFWIPIIVLTLLTASVFLNWQSSHFMHLPSVNISLEIYPKTVILMKRNANLMKPMGSYAVSNKFANYLQKFDTDKKRNAHTLTVLSGRREIQTYIIFLKMMSMLSVEMFYVGAADFNPDTIVCFWNNKLEHASPIALNLMHNAFAQHLLGSKAGIELANHPFGFSNEMVLELEFLHLSNKLGIGNAVLLVLYITVSLMVVPLISDYSTGNRRLQFLSGNNLVLYWLAHILMDLIIYVIIAIYLVVLLVVHDAVFNGDRRNYDDAQLVLNMMFILFLFGLAVLPFVYLFATLFNRMLFGFMVTLLILVGSSIFMKEVVPMLLPEITYWELIYNMFLWSPTMNMYKGIRKIHVNRALRRACENLGGCKFEKACCTLADYTDYEYPGVFSQIVMLIVLIIIYSALLYHVIKYPFIGWRSSRFIYNKSEDDSSKTSFMDSGVMLERERVNKLLPSDIKEYKLVLKDVCKNVRNKTRLREVSFIVEAEEVFGILGMCNSGKSEIIDLTSGTKTITSGDIYVEGINVRKHPLATQTLLGFCPRRNTLLEYMTVRELLHFYCMLNGRQEKYVSKIIEELATILYLEDKLNVRIDRLGFSNRRKLNVAIAILSNNDIILMDEPTHGMDEMGKMRTWHLINLMKRVGRTVVLATENIYEGIVLCDYIGIMVRGCLQNLGTVSQLSNTHSRGCTVEINRIKVIYRRKLWKFGGPSFINSSSSSSSAEDYDVRSSSESVKDDDNPKRRSTEWLKKAMRHQNVKSFIEYDLPFAELLDEYRNILIYYISFEDMTLSSIFRAMEAARDALDVYNYTVTRTSLAEIYEKDARESARICGKV